MTKIKENLKIYLVDGTMRVSNRIVKQGCVMMGEHAEYLDFSVINLPTYDAILGKTYLDNWNLAINWKANTMQWKVGTRLITVTGVQAPQKPTIVSNIFEQGNAVEQISAQRMKKVAKKEAVFLAIIRTVEMKRNKRTRQW